jgi:hypothetical protein
MKLTSAELDRVKEWFNALEDLSRDYLNQEDYVLAKKLHEELGISVSPSITSRIEEYNQGV